AALRSRAGIVVLRLVRALAEKPDADRPLRPRAADHHHPDGGAAVGGRLRVHGAPLEHRDTAAFGGRDTGHLGADRHLPKLSAGSRADYAAARCVAASRPVGRFPACVGIAATGAEAIFLAA